MASLKKQFISSFALLALLCAACFADIIQDNDFKFSLDIPEGFEVTDSTEDGMGYSFSHRDFPVNFTMKIYAQQEGTDASEILAANMSKLQAINSVSPFYWGENLCAITDFYFVLDKEYSGWAVCAPLEVENSYIVLMAYSPADMAEQCNFFMLSTLNSLNTNINLYNFPGIIMSFVYPLEGDIPLTLDIEGIKVETSIDSTAEEAANFLVNMEYSVLLMYSSNNLWKEAWQRYYRMIYRDNFGRIVRCSCDIYNTVYDKVKNKNKTNPDLAYAQTLLSWVQKFDYKRDSQRYEADFTSLPEVLCGKGNDCDSRSLLVATLLNTVQIESFILISPEYSHALVVTDINAPGQKYIPAETDREFLMGETTAKVTWGMIAQEQADRSKWIPVYLP